MDPSLSTGFFAVERKNSEWRHHVPVTWYRTPPWQQWGVLHRCGAREWASAWLGWRCHRSASGRPVLGNPHIQQARGARTCTGTAQLSTFPQTQPVTPTPLNRTHVKADLGHTHCWGWCLTYHGKYTKLGITKPHFGLADGFEQIIILIKSMFPLSRSIFLSFRAIIFLVVVQGLNPAPTFSVSGSGALLLAYCFALTSWDGFTLSSDGLRLLFL